MREPGLEPGSQRWQRRILTTILLSQKSGPMETSSGPL